MNCLDSSVLVDLLEGREDAIAFLEGTEGELFVPTIALAEVYEGLVRADAYSELETMDWATPLAFTEEAARETADIVVELERRGEPIPYPDAQIAGTVRAVGGRLVTRDADFDRVPDLDVTGY